MPSRGIGATGGASSLIINNGVVELGNGDFQRNLGSGATQFQITGGVSGFSAYGGARAVAVGNDANIELPWGSADFAPTMLVFNETTSTGDLTLENKIDLNAATRVIAVNANTATVSGVIRNSSGTAGLIKTGTGTLILSAANTYTGTTMVGRGTIQVGDGANGALNGTAGTDLTFTGTGTFKVNEASGVSQGMGALSFNAGDGTVQSVNNGGNSFLTFSSIATRCRRSNLGRARHPPSCT